MVHAGRDSLIAFVATWHEKACFIDKVLFLIVKVNSVSKQLLKHSPGIEKFWNQSLELLCKQLYANFILNVDDPKVHYERFVIFGRSP